MAKVKRLSALDGEGFSACRAAAGALSVLLLASLLPASTARAQQAGAIAGVVTTEATGAPLPGVNVVVVGTQQGAATDANGRYHIGGVAPGTYDLRASFVSYSDEVRAGVEVAADDTATVDFAMQQEATGLDELVVVGYGQTRKRDLTGSVSSIEAADLAETPGVSRIDQAMQGRAAGVRVSTNSGAPGANPEIRIRGGNSITANNEPLYVIDGVPGGDLSVINPSDIESLQVLKDAVSTSIYGARGANGVVLVTTKQGQAGEQRISFDASYGQQQIAHTVDILDGRERAQYANEHAEHTGQPAPYPDLSEVQNTDWQNEISRAAPIYNATLSLSGGTEKTRYYLSGSYFNQEGIVRSSGLQRYQMRVNLDYDLSDRLSLGTNLNLARVREDNNKVDFTEVLVDAFTSIPTQDERGEYVAINPVTSLPFDNPMARIALETNYVNRSKLTGDLFAEYQLTDGIRLRSSLGTDYTFSKLNEYLPGTLPLRALSEQGGQGSVNGTENANLVSETTAHLDQSFGEDHRVDAVAGFSYETFYTTAFDAQSAGFANDVLTFYSLEAGDPDRNQVNTGYSDWTLLSFLSRINYTFRDRYLFTVSARRDGSSRFGANNKWAFFPSAAVAWRISEEPFLRDSEALSNLKLRASYGLTGNQAIEAYATLPTLGVNTIILDGSAENVGYGSGALPSPDLKWETTRQLDVGLEAGFFDQRLSFTLDYYYERTNDLLLNAEIPFTTGFSQRIDNVGAVQNQGLEFSVEATPLLTSAFNWTTSFNVSGNRNKTVDLGEKESIDIGYGRRLIEGQPAPVFFGWEYLGTWKTQEEIDRVGTMPAAQPGYPRFRDVNGNGQLDGEGDFSIIGNPQPTFFGGFQNTFNYKGIGLSIFLQGSYGSDIFNEASKFLYFGRYLSNVYEEATGRWTPENPDSDIPRAGSEPLSEFRRPKSVLVEDGSYLRVKSASLSYQLPVERLGVAGVAQGVRVYLRGSNLWTWTNFRGFDPEVGVEGYEFASYPRARTVTVGAEFQF